MDTTLLAEENGFVLDLVQALLGAISPNMRAVTISAEARNVSLTFYLENDSVEDREEADDVASELEALQERGLASLQVNVIVGAGQWPNGVGSLSGRPVYVRRGM